jgi:hypothetical protein
MRIAILIPFFVMVMMSVDAWQPQHLPSNLPNLFIESILEKTCSASKLVTTGLLMGALCFASPSPSQALASVDDHDWQQTLQSSLRSPTEDRPQIRLPSDGTKELPSPTTVGALISLANPQLRPLASDILVIQIYDSNEQTVLLGGAKIPVAKIRFPIQIKLGSQNAAKATVAVADDWNRLSSTQDLWIDASICPEDTAPCSASEQRFQAAGVSKLLQQLPGMDESISGIRVPASLPLSVK